MKNITNIITNKYYQYTPGEFLPVRMDGEVINMGEFHKYKLRKAITSVSSRLLHTI